jgi:hypothetical protein
MTSIIDPWARDPDGKIWHPRIYRGSEGRRRFQLDVESSLRDARCDLTPAQFEQFIINKFVLRYPGWTDENLNHRPSKALVFCELIREWLSCPDMHEFLIMRSMTNHRKRPKGRRGDG